MSKNLQLASKVVAMGPFYRGKKPLFVLFIAPKNSF